MKKQDGGGDEMNAQLLCPKCDTLIDRPVSWFRGKNLRCPYCGQPVSFDQFNRGVDDTIALLSKLRPKD
jgi:hypothetical protein